MKRRRGEVAAPERKRPDRCGGQAEQRHFPRSGPTADLRADPQHGDRALGRSRRDDVVESRTAHATLREHDVGGSLEAGLVALRAPERRAVVDREGGQTDADEQEGGRRTRVARIPRQRQSRNPRRDGHPARRPLERAQRRAEQPNGQHSGDESHQCG